MLINFGDNLWVSGVFAVFVGLVLGAFYFGGLWLTVRRLSTSPSVALLFLVSMLFRISVVVAGFYVLLGNSWQQLLLGLLGFMVLRLFATRFIKSKENTLIKVEPRVTTQEVEHNAP
ncbi:F1F0 ATPase [Marinomonas ushuaiensis DSM 15871]|uniref:F1F0 ATPase n=2 Tax=Marinomonas TaxID=28253 RepID=X7E9M4_9GAMM|nr:F1F0 ATPase [Marinomonas ushuaiensis DSM 15871]